MPKIIAVALFKGGVGKTTTVLNLAAGMQKRGKQVLVIDCDPQGNLTGYLGHEQDELPTISELLLAEARGNELNITSSIRTNSEGIDYIPSNILLAITEESLATAMSREQLLTYILADETFSKYDYILIDCLTEIGLLMRNALTVADSVLIPVQAQKFAHDGIQPIIQVMSEIKRKLNPRLKLEGFVVTMVDNTVMCREVIVALEESYGNLLFNTRIRRSVEATNSTAYQKSLVGKNGKLGQDYERLTDEILSKEEM